MLTAWFPAVVADCSSRAQQEGTRGGPPAGTSQPSSDQPSSSGVTSPAGSTSGISAEEGRPRAVQLRWVRLMWVSEKARGMKASSAGSNWCSTQ